MYTARVVVTDTRSADLDLAAAGTKAGLVLRTAPPLVARFAGGGVGSVLVATLGAGGAAALSTTGATGRGGVGKIIGVTMITSAVSAIARRVFLSIGGDRLRYRVVAADVERVAPEDSSNAHQPAAQCAVSFQRFDHVRGAGWIVTASGGKKRPDRDLVAANQENEQVSHQLARPAAVGASRFATSVTSSRSVSNVAP